MTSLHFLIRLCAVGIFSLAASSSAVRFSISPPDDAKFAKPAGAAVAPLR